MKKRKTTKAVSEIKPTKVIQKCSALFQKPKKNFLRSDEIWFENSPIGVNKLGGMMKEISLTASLGKVYTNHCVSSTTISALDEAGIPIHRIMQT